jgi:CRP/FNR family transcriptional regulator
VTAFNFAGDLVMVPGNGPHAYELHTLVASELIVFPYKALRNAVAEDPAILARLLDNCDAALSRCREKALMIGRKTASERLAGFLVMMAARIGVAQGDRILLDLPMSRRDIGDSLGLTIETISRQFSLLRQARQIATEGRSKVLLLDFHGLQERAGHLGELGPAFSSKFALDQC